MRRRITRTTVAVVAVALVVATAGTAVASWLGARADARRDLARQAAQISGRLEEVQRPPVLNALAAALRLQDAEVTTRPPPGMGAEELAAGQTTSGIRGRLVYAVAAVRRPSGAVVYVVLTRRVEARLAGGAWIVVAAAAALAVAALAAVSLSRTLTRPLREARAATDRIAGGDLSARVPVDPRDGEELAGLAASINTMAAGLERSRGLERQFLMSVSHDLRTPLTSIRGYAEALAEGEAPDPARAAEVILSESRRLERLVQDLLELASLGSRRFSLQLRPVDVAGLLAQSVEAFGPAAERAGVEVRLDAEPCAATADPDRLAQVVGNLLENALKYAAAVIEIRAGPAGDAVEIVLSDDGPGIAPGDLPHVFEPFFRSARTQAREVGSGLGLAIVRELVVAMGGTVTAGDAMRVTLPWAGGARRTGGAAAGSPPPTG